MLADAECVDNIVAVDITAQHGGIGPPVTIIERTLTACKAAKDFDIAD